MSSRPDCPYCGETITMGQCSCGFNGPRDYENNKSNKKDLYGTKHALKAAKKDHEPSGNAYDSKGNKMPVPKGHTPGPWFYGKMYGDDAGQPGVIGIGNFEADDHYEDTICEVWDGNHIAEANAKLIVAAVNHYLGLDK